MFQKNQKKIDIIKEIKIKVTKKQLKMVKFDGILERRIFFSNFIFTKKKSFWNDYYNVSICEHEDVLILHNLVLQTVQLFLHVMLQLACVLTTGGILLFSTAICPDSQIFSIIIGKILDSKLLECDLSYKCYSFKYSYDSVMGLIFVAIWRKEIMLNYVDKFLKILKFTFEQGYKQIKWKDDTIIDAPNFSTHFNTAFDRWNKYVEVEETKGKVMSTFEETERGKKLKKAEKAKDKEPEAEKVPNAAVAAGSADSTGDRSPQFNSNEQSPEMSPDQSPDYSPEMSPRGENEDSDLSPRDRFLKSQKERNSAKKKKSKKESEIDEKGNTRTWEFKTGALSKSDIDAMDRSRLKNAEKSTRSSNIYLEEEKDSKALNQFIDSDKQIEESTFFKKMIGSVQKVIGNKSLTEEDLRPVLTAFKQKLMEKNVALEVADKITESVGQSLLETKTKSFTSIQSTVKTAIHEALVKILTPKRHIDLIADVAKAKLEHRPYVAVFIGVNGVGKSTNLAKVAYMLKNSKFSVMLAACDNFRAGAVEQLQVHGRNLDIPVFDRGYKEEPPEIAYQAVKEAIAKRIDVVLIDTAGRMQDNTPLMKALARLVEVNKPNLVVFIGEALVGNDAIDQITKFNNALSDFSQDTVKRQIDAILLSKFDTVDDKVGTAVSMCYTTSKPILYVGVGQKYQNLKKLNIGTIVHALMS